jgi:hypothetical protein
MPLVSHLLRQRGLEPLTYCLEGAFEGLSMAIMTNHKRLINKEIKPNQERAFYHALSPFLHQY